MTRADQIRRLAAKGLGVTAIAAELGGSRQAVSAFCARHGIAVESRRGDGCGGLGRPGTTQLVIALARRHPDWTARQIAEAADCLPEFVRVVAQRHGITFRRMRA